MNEKWECYLCCYKQSFDENASGFLGNYHPLCKNCADIVLEENHPDKFRLTYHHRIGDLNVVANVPISSNIYNFN